MAPLMFVDDGRYMLLCYTILFSKFILILISSCTDF